MFVIVSHPFADFRMFVDGDTRRVASPSLPLGVPGKDFIRSSGILKSRKAGGVVEWPGEEIFVDASSALILPNAIGKTQLGTAENKFSIKHVIRRLHSDGNTARFDIGFKIDEVSFAPDKKQIDLFSVVNEILGMDVGIRSADTTLVNRSLVSAGKLLAEHFLISTTKHSSPRVECPLWWFSSGQPTAIIEYEPADDKIIAGIRKKLKNITRHESGIAHSWLNVKGIRCGVWFVEKTTSACDSARRLRIHLLRLHAEVESLRLILSRLNSNDWSRSGGSNDAQERIQLYLNKTLGGLQKEARYGYVQSPLLEIARQAHDNVLEGYSTTLLHMRRQVLSKVDNYLSVATSNAKIVNHYHGGVMNTSIQLGNVSVGGDFNLAIAESITDSFNRVKNAQADETLKARLEELTQTVTGLVAKLSPPLAERVSQDLKSLVSEALSPTPRKAWYEVSAQGILDATKSVAELAAPVTSAISAVLALMG